MRVWFNVFFEKIRHQAPRFPLIALGLPTAPASKVVVLGSGPGAPTAITHPIGLWPIGSRWWRTDGSTSSESEYIQTAGGWFAVPLNGDFTDGVHADTIDEYTSGAGVTIDGVLVKDGAVNTNTLNEKDSGSGVTVDGCLIKDGAAAKLATAAFYQSPSPVTATGSSQAVAHGLAAAPRAYWVEVLSGHNGSGAAGTQVPTITWGTVDGTNLTVTVSAGATFKLHAIL